MSTQTSQNTPRRCSRAGEGSERRSMYQLKVHVPPRLYWHGMLKGRG